MALMRYLNVGEGDAPLAFQTRSPTDPQRGAGQHTRQDTQNWLHALPPHLEGVMPRV